MPRYRGIKGNEKLDARPWTRHIQHVKNFGSQFHDRMEDKITLHILEKCSHSKLMVTKPSKSAQKEILTLNTQQIRDVIGVTGLYNLKKHLHNIGIFMDEP